MENYGSSESNDGKTSSKESSSAKPDIAKAQSLAELLIHKDAMQDQHHRVIWEREEKDKEEKSGDSSSSSKSKTTPHTMESRESKELKLGDSEAKAKPTAAEASDNSAEADDSRLSELAPEEAHAIAEQYANGRATELNAEQVDLPADSPEQAAAAANASLMRKLAEKLRAEPEGDPQQAIAEAADEVIAEAGLQDVEPTNPIQSTAEVFGPSSGSPENEPEDLARQPANATTPAPQPAGSNGGNNPPPGPPRYPFMPGFPGYPGGPGGPNGFNPNASPTPSSPNTTPTITPAEMQYYARQAENRGLLLGGIVGYLIGRRRGRIKTEKRLIPVQKKLETQVTNLHESIASREQQIRTLAAEKARAKQAAEAATTAPHPIKMEATAVPIPRAAEAVLPFQSLLPAAQAERSLQPERITAPRAPEAPRPATAPAEGSPEKHVERMNHQELLKAAETVIIEGASLRQVYEAHSITEKGLRHVMTEYLRGGDVKKALDQELAIKELTYERDPQLRDSLSADTVQSGVSGVSGGSQAVQSPSPALGVLATTSQLPASVAPPPETKPESKKPAAPNNFLQGTLIRVWVVFVVVLVILAAILLIL